MKTKITDHPHYSRWRGVKGRCLDPKNKAYKHYGERGIKICSEWLNNPTLFLLWCDKTFIPGKTLDRINNDGPYSPDNCRWADQYTQTKNSRNTVQKVTKSLENVVLAHKKMHEKYGNPSIRTSKKCPKCNEFKSINEYWKNKASLDGLCSYCIPCNSLLRKRT